MTEIIQNFLLIQIYSVITCGNLKAPEHGRISCSNRDRYDSKCSYECDTGYELIGAQVIFHFFALGLILRKSGLFWQRWELGTTISSVIFQIVRFTGIVSLLPVFKSMPDWWIISKHLIGRERQQIRTI